MPLFQEEDAGGYRFTVRPNCALSWRWTKLLILGFAGCLAAVGWYFAALGAWLVLPFAGLELAVLVAGFYLSALAGNTREVIEIRGNHLRVLRGGNRLQDVATLSRHWTRVVLVRDPRGWHPSRLVLRCHDRSVEIVTRLVESEREDLAAVLDAALGCDGRDGCPPLSDSVPQGIATPAHAGDVPRGYLEGEVHAMTRIWFPVDGEKTTSSANNGAYVRK